MNDSSAPARESNSANYHKTKGGIRTKAIEEIILELEKYKSTFNSMWDLASSIAKIYNERKILIPTKNNPDLVDRISSSTLISKEADYRTLLERYLRKNQSKLIKNINSHKVATKDAEISNLKTQLIRVTQESKNRLQKEEKLLSSSKINTSNELEVALDASHKIIIALLEEFSDCVVIQDDELINLSKRVNNQIATKEILQNSNILNSYLFKMILKN